MSYSTWKGSIKFKKKDHFEKFLAVMINSGRYSMKHNSWMSDGDEPINIGGYEEKEEEVLDPKNLTVNLPNYPIDNFHRLLNDLEKNTWEGQLVGATDDGCFEGWVQTPDGEEVHFDLEDWAKEHGHSLEWDEDNEDWLTEDRIDVMEAFLDNPYPPANSKKFIGND